MNSNTYQPEPTSLVWGCGHTASVVLAIDTVTAAEQIAAYTQIDCLACAKSAHQTTRTICWSDLGSR